MSLSLLTGQQRPENTETQAYVGNSVVNVYMSFDPNDLTDEGLARLSERGSQGSMFFLNSDTQDSLITAFSYDLVSGQEKREQVTVEIINPSIELEIKLLSYYDKLFPSKKPTYATLAAAQNEYQDLINSNTEKITYKDLGTKLPTIFVRFGYGDKLDGGSSAIKNCRLTGMNYKLSANKDKVAVLRLYDTYTTFQSSKTFNNRVNINKLPILESDGTLKRASTIVKECLGDYTAIYPGMMPWISLQGQDKYDEQIDSFVFKAAKALASFGPDERIRTDEKYFNVVKNIALRRDLNSNEKELFEKLLDRPVTYKAIRDYEIDGSITLPVLVQAYELFFKALGLGFEDGSYKKPFDIPKTLSMSQVNNDTDDVTNTGQNPSETQDANSKQSSKDTTLVQVPQKPMTQFNGGPGRGFYSYWPQCWEEKPRQPDQGTTFADVYSPGIRPQKIGYTLSSVGGAVVKYELDAFKVYFNGAGNKFGVRAPGVSSLEENSYQNTDGLFFNLPTEGSTNTGAVVRFMDLDGMPSIQDFEGYIYIDGLDGVTRLTNETGQSLGGLQTSGLILRDTGTTNPFGGPGVSYLSPITSSDNVLYSWIDEVADSNDGKLVSTDFLRGSVEEGGARVLRDMTVQEKKTALNLGTLPIWIKPGIWNANRIPELQKVNNEYGDKYEAVPFNTTIGFDSYGYPAEFSLTELSQLINTTNLDVVKQTFAANSPDLSNMKPLNVSIHTSRGQASRGRDAGKVGAYYGTNQEFGFAPLVGYGGERIDYIGGPISKVPLYDLETKELVTGWVRNEDGTYSIPEEIKKYAPNIHEWQLVAASPFKPGQFCSTLELEPTIETSEHLLKLSTTYNKFFDENLFRNRNFRQESSEAPERTFDDEDDVAFEGYVVMGTQGAAPHITKTFYNFLDSLNSVVLGTNNKLIAAPLELKRLSPAALENTVNRLFKEAPQELIDDLLKERPSVLLIGPEDRIQEVAFKNLVKPILSFPEITDADPNVFDNTAVFLNYGTKDSIVTDLDFDAENLFLVELMSAYAGIQGIAGLDAIGDITKVSKKQIYALVKNGKIKEGEENEAVTSAREAALEAIKLEEEQGPPQIAINKDGDSIHNEFIPLPVAQYFRFIELDENDTDARGFQSFLNTTMDGDTLKDFFYNQNPETRLDKTYFVEKREWEYSTKTDLAYERVTRVPRPIRFVNYYALFHKIGPEFSDAKITDSKYQFMKAMRDYAWQLEITTLGVPEISEIQDLDSQGRDVVLTVFDVRNDLDNTPHWLSGIYQIMSINHSISPSDGYTTSYKLVKEGPHPTFAKEILNG